MEIQYYGGNCVRISTKKANILVDDNLADLGLKTVTKSDDIALKTTYSKKDLDKELALTINQPGEYEVSAVSIQGIGVRAHMDEEGAQTATIFKLTANDLRIAVLGHIHPDLDEDQLEAIGTVDILILPVGGHGFTLDAIGALKLVKKIEPKIIIPTHYADSKVKYEVPQADLKDVLKEMSMEASQTLPKLKIKASDIPLLSELIVLERQ